MSYVIRVLNGALLVLNATKYELLLRGVRGGAKGVIKYGRFSQLACKLREGEKKSFLSATSIDTGAEGSGSK